MAGLSETITSPSWTFAAAVAAIIIMGALAGILVVKRQLAAAVAVALAAAVALAVPAWLHAGANRPGQNEAVAARDISAERQALEARRAELSARATLPGSSLACLDALAGEPVETACEQTVFASPLSVAVAVSYAAARLRLLADGIAFARRADAGYEAGLADLRLAAENDAYGIYAHVLATRDGCTHERCAAFALLRDPSTLKVHLRQRRYATYVAEHRERWGGAASSAAVPVSSIAAAARFPPILTAPHPVEPPTAPPVTTAAAPPVALVEAEAPPLPKARPSVALAARAEAEGEASAPVAAAAENAPAAAPEVAPARETVPPARRALVPPSASVLPNISFPSASSIPAISIMAAEPKLPPEPAPAPSTARRPSPPQ